MTHSSVATKLATMLPERRFVLANLLFLRCAKEKEEWMCAQDFTKNPITPLSRLNWTVCVCMQNLIYDEAVEFWSASRENCVFFSCVNVRLGLQLPSILEWNREASNQNEVHKSECDKPTACVRNYCIPSGYRAVSSNGLFNNRIVESSNLWCGTTLAKHLCLNGVRPEVNLCAAEWSYKALVVWGIHASFTQHQ